MRYLGLLVQALCVLGLIFCSDLQKSVPFIYWTICVIAVLKLMYDCYVMVKKKNTTI